MKFLLTNDDGIHAPGLAALARAIQPLGEVVVVAPHEHVSGCSHQATTHRPLELQEIRAAWHMLDGSPVDCTRVGLFEVAADVEWVIAGINQGGNLGADIYLSGTVAAAREACLLGKPALAISQFHRRLPIDWEQAARWSQSIVQLLLQQEFEPGQFWNVNLPQPDQDGPLDRITIGCKFCPVDSHPLPVTYERQDGKLHYRGNYQQRPRAPGTDVDVCFGGQVSISRLSVVPHAPQDQRQGGRHSG